MGLEGLALAEEGDIAERLRLEQGVEGREDVALVLAPLELVLLAPHPLEGA